VFSRLLPDRLARTQPRTANCWRKQSHFKGSSD
jgi:hypothetical protein